MRDQRQRGRLAAALLFAACGSRHTHAAGTMRCAGTHAVDRACLVQDLYYDTQERKFTYHGTGIVNNTDVGTVTEASTAYFAAATCEPPFCMLVPNSSALRSHQSLKRPAGQLASRSATRCNLTHLPTYCTHVCANTSRAPWQFCTGYACQLAADAAG